jgi:FMN phosphatase YigB (HAD superfamily)
MVSILQKRFIDKFEVVLLDMGNTFMFDVDRFRESDNLDSTYKNLGGDELQGDKVFKIASAIFNQMIADSQNPGNYNNFPKVSDYLNSHPISSDLAFKEKNIIEKVIAEHEMGTIPEKYIKALKELAQTHRLGIISDIWSDSESYFHIFQQGGIKDLFDIILFSSDLGIIKPSPVIFKKAIDYFGIDVSKLVYVGDSFRRDVRGAKNVGISAIWINAGNEDFDRSSNVVFPDITVMDLTDILYV